MALPLLGFFFCVIAVLTAVAGVTISFFGNSTSARIQHYPRPVVERNVTATNSEPRLFMVVPETKNGSPTKDGSPVKNIVEANSAAVEANSAAVPAQKAEVKKNRPHKPKVFGRLRNNYERPAYYGNAQGYAEEFRNGPQRPFSNW